MANPDEELWALRARLARLALIGGDSVNAVLHRRVRFWIGSRVVVLSDQS
jgi:hypothetical protein